MATNPMQRKTRTVITLGVLLLISILIIAFLAFNVINLTKEKQEQAKKSKTTYVLNKDVKSGEKIELDMLTAKVVSSDVLPSTAVKLTGEEDVIAKVDIAANTILTDDLITESSNKINNDTRTQEYNVVILPINLEDGDYIDIRLMLPSGQDYIVTSKKKVEIPDLGGVLSTDTVRINMSEDEILSMSNAIYDAYKINGSKLYATKYTDPGIQEAATPTYPINSETADLINKDPNILTEARVALKNRYSNGGSELRSNYINNAINENADNAQSNVESGMSESITNSQDSRKQYLDSLSGY